MLGGEQRDRRSDRDADEADLTVSDVAAACGLEADGDCGPHRRPGDPPVGETRQVRHEDEVAGAGKAACEPPGADAPPR